jgi:hypothetical protein
MTEHTANHIVDTRARMLAPLAVFGVACFLFAGAVKFHVKGGDIWFSRPMGAPVTCLFLAFVGWAAARWFFGAPPAALPSKLLAALVVMLPLMGLLGVVQGATHDPAAAEDPTLLGGTLGAMLAGPRAFGSLGTTIAGILFAILALFGGYLARRITAPAAPPARADDPYAVIKAMHKHRAAQPEAVGAAAAVAEEEPPAAETERGGLFSPDAELEPAPPAAAIETARSRVEVLEEPDADEGIGEPVRAPILAGLVDQAEADEDDEPLGAAPIFATSLMHAAAEEEEAVAAVALALDDEETELLAADDEAVEPDQDDTVRILRAPALEPDEDATAEADDETDEEVEVEARFGAGVDMGDDDEDEDAVAPVDDEAAGAVEIAGGESPDLAPEWLAAPAAFHSPRAIAGLRSEASEVLDILDVDRAQESVPEAVERPRFRVKADYVREEAAADAVEEEPAGDIAVRPIVWQEVEDEPSPEAASPMVMVTEASEPADELPAPAAALEEQAPEAATLPELEPEREPEPEVAAPAVVEAQLELPDMPVQVAPDAAADESPKPRRRMRSAAKKDWASWEEEAPRERPRLRLVRSEESEEQTQIPAARSDDTYERAVALVVQEDRCSVSLLQRNMGVTFGEATALIDRMYQQGVVGPYQPTGRRDVLIGKKGAAAAEES